MIVLSLVAGHTLNWFLNGNFNLLFIHLLFVRKVTKGMIFSYLESIKGRLTNTDWLLYSAAFGSICRGELKDSSDIDISLVRKSGFKNALKSIWFIIKEKKNADIKGIPLEIYISDSPENSVKRYLAENNAILLINKEKVLEKYYNQILDIAAAKRLNNFPV